MISVCFQSKPFNIRVIQLYAPTSKAKVECFYEELQDLLDLTWKKKKCPFHHRELECKSRKSGVTDKFGLGVQNDAGQRLTEFFKRNTLVIANNLFQQHMT